ncbi:MAG: hypothetical protein KR126chlam5_00901 [Candidatus Anoxychlamydiales bacterium]|nr:hypothetical protein [Candidatus Anoxychlamydiales bacterium]
MSSLASQTTMDSSSIALDRVAQYESPKAPSSINNLKITLPRSGVQRFVDKLTFIPRVIMVAIRTLSILPVFGFVSLFYRSDFSDPKKITNKKIPILLIHGSNANQRQWDFFRYFLKGRECGHIFAVNLNDKAFINDKKDISEYAEKRIVTKIKDIKQKYLKDGFDLNEVIIIGHSMGGLIGGEYALNHATDVKVKALITLNTPWHGSWAADIMYDVSAKPEGAFLRTNPATKALREKLIEKERAGEINLYTFSSSLDPLVRPSSSALPISNENQIFSKVHDHYSVKVDPKLARTIRDRWVIPNTPQD